MTFWFISDLHLGDDAPAITAALLRFLQGPARTGERLYILGDLFDAWIGDDHPGALGEQVAEALRRLPAGKFFLPGNRDFLVGSAFLAAADVQSIDDGAIVELPDQTRARLMHGDSLCTDDVAYQRFRSQVRNPAWQSAFLAKPVADRLAYADYARRESRAATRGKSAEIMDVAESAASETVLAQPQVDWLVHGHTHRPAAHRLRNSDTRPVTRWVLPDWAHSAGALRADRDGWTRCYWSLTDG